MKQLISTLFFLPLLLIACQQSGIDEGQIKDNLQKHITYLADDALEGRLTGSKGAQKAAEYIVDQFKKIGITTTPEYQDFRQPFDFTMRKYVTPKTSLHFGNSHLTLNEDFYPLPYSSNDSIQAEAVYVKYGIQAPELDYSDYDHRNNLEGKIFVIEVSSPDGIHPHSKYVEHHDLDKRIATAKSLGADGIIFVNSQEDAEDPRQKLSVKIQPMGVPVAFLQNDQYIDSLDQQQVTLSVEIKKQQETGHNVFGMIDNDQPYTVVIGAHYDHLGYGTQSSLSGKSDSAIHNGADDNASGVAMMIELARTIKETDTLKNYNYMLVAFSGEELGLYGSNHFVDHSPITPDSLHYMLNMDMVGRLDSSNTLIINGTGTSPAFAQWDSLPILHLNTKVSSSGIGPSDHTPFYLENVPVVHFFTGTHADYHKPSDDEDKINYTGMLKVYNYLTTFIARADATEKLSFTPTDDEDNPNVPDFTVTLGVVPDYVFDGEGMKIDAVREGRTAANAGIKDGDIVIKMGPVNVKDMQNYMQALSHFKKGDTTKVTVKRDSDTLTYQVTF